MSELPTLQHLVQKSAAYLRARGIDNARRESEWIFCHCLGLERLVLYTRFDMLLNEAQVADLRARVSRRGKREPLAYVLGTQPFCGLDLQVNPAVLVPRPETEELVERVLADSAVPATAQVADIGCGSGAIACALQHARPEWTVHGAEIDAAARAVALANVARLGLPIPVHASDLARGLPAGPWDLWVANLPYVADSERALCSPETAFEPDLALFAADDGLGLIKRLIVMAEEHLRPGLLWLEHGFRHDRSLAAFCAARGLATQHFEDLSGLPRFTRILL